MLILKKMSSPDEISSLQSRLGKIFDKKEELSERIKHFEKERMSLLSDLKKVKDSNLQHSIDPSKVEALRICFENRMTKAVEDSPKSASDKTLKKCRHHNRGYCKFKEHCNFFHSLIICPLFLTDGICRNKRCLQRHPKDCRYWTRKNEGCIRQTDCKYLHNEKKKYSLAKEAGNHTENSEDSENDRKLEQMSYECVQRDFNIQTKDNLSKHLESKHTVVYSCEQCQYKADDANHLDIHIETIHVNDQSEQHAIKYWDSEENVEKIFYACNECDYNTYETNETSLPAHNCEHLW